MAFRPVKRRAPLLLGAGVALLVSAGLARAAEPISWDQAEQHVGEEATVRGRVLGVRCTKLSCLLAFDPTFNRFTAVVQAAKFGDLPPDQLEQRYTGRQVEVHGKIVDNDKKPEIVLQSPQDITLTVGERKKERDEERTNAAQAQVETLARIGDVLDRVSALTERMAAVQERMELLLGELEQRNAALAQALATPAPSAPVPSYGEPQARPAYQALRTIKRGMSRDEVVRLVGEPISVEDSGGGWATWYYGYGRSISFDARGRAQSFVGFPAP